jgi:hypothetical protein
MNITPFIQEFFREQNVKVVLFTSAETQSFVNLEKFIDFIEREKMFWQDCGMGRLAECDKLGLVYT